MRFPSLLAVIAALLFTASPQPAVAQDAADVALFSALRDADMQLARIGYRLTVANAPLCDRLVPGTGLQLHSLDQYARGTRDEARAYFGFETMLGVEGVVADSPAADAGVRAGDSILRIGKTELSAGFSDEGGEGTTERISRVYDSLAALPPGAPIELELVRDGVRIATTLHPRPACASRFELRLANDYEAKADGQLVQISSKLLERYGEARVAAAVAHELSHNVLRHRERLAEEGVDYGLLSGFGKNVKYFRQTETEADILSVYLLANAGYDIQDAVRFWKDFGPRHAGGWLRSRSHPGWRDRVATIEREIARIETMSARPILPAILNTRDRPLDGDWEKLLARE